ncbi:DUF2399 domain-containing protein [Streptomyces sp. NPDC055051]
MAWTRKWVRGLSGAMTRRSRGRTETARRPHRRSRHAGPWNDALAGALAERGVAVVEELVADTLMEDLAALGAAARPRAGG